MTIMVNYYLDPIWIIQCQKPQTFQKNLFLSLIPFHVKQNPLGIKGCGEAGISGALPTIMNAIVNALESNDVDGKFKYARNIGENVGNYKLSNICIILTYFLYLWAKFGIYRISIME